MAGLRMSPSEGTTPSTQLELDKCSIGSGQSGGDGEVVAVSKRLQVGSAQKGSLDRQEHAQKHGGSLEKPGLSGGASGKVQMTLLMFMY